VNGTALPLILKLYNKMFLSETVAVRLCAKQLVSIARAISIDTYANLAVQ